jgi:hypothetical protein
VPFLYSLLFSARDVVVFGDCLTAVVEVCLLSGGGRQRRRSRVMSDSIKIVYLDQNAASYLAMSANDQYWAALRSSLRSGYEQKRIVCPVPLKTLVESAPCPQNQRVAIDQLFKEIGGGITMKAFHELLA